MVLDMTDGESGFFINIHSAFWDQIFSCLLV